jgi:D-alanine-D-alanine ligase
VVDHADGFYSYQAKYIDAEGARLVIPALLRPSEQTAIQLMAERSFRALEGAGMARVDLFLTASGELYLNEINAIPGFTAISMYPQLWRASGIDAQTLVSRLLELALERHAQRQALRTTR